MGYVGETLCLDVGYGERKRGQPGAIGCFQLQVLCWPLPRLLLSQSELWLHFLVKADKHSLCHGLPSNEEMVIGLLGELLCQAAGDLFVAYVPPEMPVQGQSRVGPLVLLQNQPLTCLLQSRLSQ